MRTLAACVLALGLGGCVQGLGWHDRELSPRWSNAEHQRVYLKEEGALPQPAELKSRGLVSGSYLQPRAGRSSEQACDSVIEEAITGLLLKAERLGGNSIRELEARGPRDWLAELVCRVRPGAYPFADPTARVRIRGLAVDDPDVGAPGAAIGPSDLPEAPKDVHYGSFLYACRAGEPLPRGREPKRKEMCADLNECLSGYIMSRRPEAKRNEMCAERLREKYENFDALMQTH